MTADFQVLPYVTPAGRAGAHPASFVIEDRVPGLHQTADNPTPGAAAALRATGTDTVEQETARP